MTRLMYDSIDPFAIPTTAAMVGGYVDADFAWPATGWARFPNAVKARIAVASYVPGTHVYDCETGDFTPAGVVDVVLVARSHGENPTVYMNASTWPAVREAFASRGVAQPPYWVAAYPGAGSVIPTGAIAHQYANDAAGSDHYSGGHYDLSVVADFWPGVDDAAGNATRGGDSLDLTNPIDKQVVDQVNSIFVATTQGYTAQRIMTQEAAILAAIADLKAHPAVVSDPSVLPIVERIETALKAA